MKTARYDLRTGKVHVEADGDIHPYAYNSRTQMIGVKEMAKYLGVSLDAIEKQIDNDEKARDRPALRYVMVAGLRRTTQADFALWLRLKTMNEYVYKRIALPPVNAAKDSPPTVNVATASTAVKVEPDKGLQPLVCFNNEEIKGG